MPEASHRFFTNRGCRYFPCHGQPEPGQFNCLFCFCPLYLLGEQCGGDFIYTEKGKKNCKHCAKPHHPEFYDELLEKLRNA